MIISNKGYSIKKLVKKDVTTTEGNEDINGNTVYLHNAGSAAIYIDKVTGVDNTKWELAAGEKLGPIVFKGKIYFVGANTSTLKILFADGIV